ncbi:hypothetical protein D1007_27217 [Hordeum vulgare]|nr:hypothetical protein D1007_27217 [Hordeum vulgare]
MGRYIMRTGSMGLGSMRFTSPRITGHRHLSDRSSAAAELLRNMPSPPQHSLCGVGVSGSLPVRNDAHVISPASGVTQSVGADRGEGGDPPNPPAPPTGMPGKPGAAMHGACELGAGGACAWDGGGVIGLPLGDGGVILPADGGDSLERGKPRKPLGLRCLVPGYQSTLVSARRLVAAAASAGCSTAAANVTTTSKTTVVLRVDAAIATKRGCLLLTSKLESGHSV